MSKGKKQGKKTVAGKKTARRASGSVSKRPERVAQEARRPGKEGHGGGGAEAAGDPKKMELLAPAGNMAAFEAALSAGADAVYIGAPALNARALGRDFTLPEIGAMTDYAHGHGKKLYLAMNSLMKEEEVPQAVRLLAELAHLRPDALIVQDLGVYHLARRFFPELRLHASTLLGAHNSMAVGQFAEMGFSRVVLARELTLPEIETLCRRSPVEIEVFVHGALCFAYSGLCLFSSYLGGKSGLRGRCVQPCRRRYSWSAKEGGAGRGGGYLFSMNDLCGIDHLADLARVGVTSLKIEGRLRSASYVERVVRAYRLVLDGPPEDEKIRAEARHLLEGAMSRRTTAGYFGGLRTDDILAPAHSGNIGLFLGRIELTGKGRRAELVLRERLEVGDRLRLHQEKSGERFAFTLTELAVNGEERRQALAGERVSCPLPVDFEAGDLLYKVDAAARRELEGKSGLETGLRPVDNEILARIGKRAETVLRQMSVGAGPGKEPPVALAVESGKSFQKKGGQPRPGGPKGGQRQSAELWLCLDVLSLLKQKLAVEPDRIVVPLNRDTYRQFGAGRRYLEYWEKKLIWALPPVIHEGALRFYASAVHGLLRAGFYAWQLGHISQLGFFGGPRRPALYGGFTLNVLNSQSLAALAAHGLRGVQFALETDRASLESALAGYRAGLDGGRAGRRISVGLTVYGRPPLFTARLVDGHFRYNKPFVSPKGESFVLEKRDGLTVALGMKPFSLLDRANDLAAAGLDFLVIDLRSLRLKAESLEELLKQFGRAGRGPRLSSFNFDGALL